MPAPESTVNPSVHFWGVDHTPPAFDLGDALGYFWSTELADRDEAEAVTRGEACPLAVCGGDAPKGAEADFADGFRAGVRRAIAA